MCFVFLKYNASRCDRDRDLDWVYFLMLYVCDIYFKIMIRFECKPFCKPYNNFKSSTYIKIINRPMKKCINILSINYQGLNLNIS